MKTHNNKITKKIQTKKIRGLKWLKKILSLNQDKEREEE